MKLFEHQKDGIEWLKKRPRAILADEMGLGKTIQAIIASRENSPSGTILVICPASLKINWSREIQSVYPNEGVHIIESGKEKLIPENVEWVIVNYDMLEKYRGQLLSYLFGCVIIDEAHYIKGKKTKRTVSTMDIANLSPRVYCLTGTPVMNRPIELFNLLKVVKHPLGRVRTTYAIRYCGAYTQQIFIPKLRRMIYITNEQGATRLPELNQMIQDVFLRRMKSEVLNLPEKIHEVSVTELDKAAQRAYDTAWDEYIEWVSNNPDSGKDADNVMTARHLVELTKLKQVCSFSKIPAIVQDIERAVEAGQKVIVFSQFTKTIHDIASAAKEIKYDTGKTTSQGSVLYKNIDVVTLTGENNTKERQEAVDRFQKDDTCKVFVANIKAGGVGITLTAATNVYFADMEWSPELHSQAEDRAHRIGQTGTVNVRYYIVKDTIEEDIVDILGRKRDIIKSLTEGKELDGLEQTMAKEFMGRLSTRLGIDK